MNRYLSLAAVLGLFGALTIGCGEGGPPANVPGGKAVAPGGKRSEEAAVRHLLQTMRDRLLIMNEVARTKWALKRGILDTSRELVLVQAQMERGKSAGLDPAQTRRFFTAQIEAAKMIQQAHFDHWKLTGHGPVSEATTDLNELRKQIDAVNQKLIAGLAESNPWLGKPAGWELLVHWSREEVAGKSIDDVVRATAVAPLFDKKADVPAGFRPKAAATH